MYRYFLPAENIGIQCQQQEFDLNLLREHFQKHLDQAEELKRIPLVKKKAPKAENMDWEEIEEKMKQYCQLWQLYSQASCELTRRSKISQEEAVRACKIYGPYIRDVLQQAEEAMTIFMMEKELRNIEGRVNFPIPAITLHDTKIDNAHQSRKILETVDEELIRILNTVKECELAYQKGQEATKQQARAARSTLRPKCRSGTVNLKSFIGKVLLRIK